jgi:hypothetical protein
MAEVYYYYGITTQIASIRGGRVIYSGIREIVVVNQGGTETKNPATGRGLMYELAV